MAEDPHTRLSAKSCMAAIHESQHRHPCTRFHTGLCSTVWARQGPLCPKLQAVGVTVGSDQQGQLVGGACLAGECVKSTSHPHEGHFAEAPIRLPQA